MLIRQRRYSKEEIAQRGDEIYQREIRAKVELSHKGKFIAIDIETGAWEMDVDALTACDRLLAHLPDVQVWLVRVGARTVHHLGMALMQGYEPKTKTLPQTDSLTELAQFWDTHDVTDFEDELEEVAEPVFEQKPTTASIKRALHAE